MRVYLAGAFSRKNEIAEKTQELENMGIIVTSSWVRESESENKVLDCDEELAPLLARKDLQEIMAADAVVLFTHDPTHKFVRGGRMHEAGFAMGLGKSLLVCGPKENIFHYLPEVNVFSTWEELKETLTKAVLV